MSQRRRERRLQKNTAHTAGEPENPLREARERLAEAERLRQEGKLGAAQSICEKLLARYSDYMGALHTLGLILADKHDYSRALVPLVKAAMLNPRSWITLTALSGVYLRLGAREMAAQTLEQAARLRPDDVNILVTLGEIYRDDREYELAVETFRKALEEEPDLAVATQGLASTLSSLGEDAKAAHLLEGLVKRQGVSVTTLYSLARLPKDVVSVDLVSLLQDVERSTEAHDEEDKIAMEFTRAAIFDKAGRHEAAWARAVAGNRPLAAKYASEIKVADRWQDTSIAELRKQTFHIDRKLRNDAKHPISLFILGPSRSGKTTVEGLVSKIEGVKRGYENPIADTAVKRAFQGAGFLTSSQYVHLPYTLDEACREVYCEELARRAGEAKVFTNTSPIRIHDGGRVAQILPNVRFVFVKRNIDDVLLRIFMTRYREANYYAYDLHAARRHIVWYYEMIDRLSEKLPDICRVVHYQDVVSGPAKVVEMVAELCGLDAPAEQTFSVGDDRGCSEPYQGFIDDALNAP